MRYIYLLFIVAVMTSCSKEPFEARYVEAPQAYYEGVPGSYDEVYEEGGYDIVPEGGGYNEVYEQPSRENEKKKSHGFFRKPFEERYEEPSAHDQELKRDRKYKEPFGTRFYYEGKNYFPKDSGTNLPGFEFDNPQYIGQQPYLLQETEPTFPPLRVAPGVGKLYDLHGPFKKVYFKDPNRNYCGRQFDLDWMEANDPAGATEIILSYATELQHTKFLRLEYSWVYFDHDIGSIHLEFSTQNIMEVREARQMLVDVVDGLLTQWNNDPIIAAQIEKPFTERDVNIYINLESFWGFYGDPFYVGWLVLEDGITYLYAYDTKDRLINYWHSRVEPFFKSRQYVRIERAAEERYKKTHAPAPNTYLRKEQAFDIP